MDNHGSDVISVSQYQYRKQLLELDESKRQCAALEESVKALQQTAKNRNLEAESLMRENAKLKDGLIQSERENRSLRTDLRNVRKRAKHIGDQLDRLLHHIR